MRHRDGGSLHRDVPAGVRGLVRERIDTAVIEPGSLGANLESEVVDDDDVIVHSTVTKSIISLIGRNRNELDFGFSFTDIRRDYRRDYLHQLVIGRPKRVC